MQSPIAARVTLFITSADILARHFSTRNALLASGLGVVFALLGFQWLEGQLGAPMLDMMVGYQRDGLFERLHIYGEEGRILHARFTLLLDMVFPFLYGALWVGLISLAARGTNLTGGVLAVPALMLVDWVENIQILALLWGFPDLTDSQIAAASATTQGKIWALQFAALWLGGLLLVQIGRLVRRRFF